MGKEKGRLKILSSIHFRRSGGVALRGRRGVDHPQAGPLTIRAEGRRRPSSERPAAPPARCMGFLGPWELHLGRPLAPGAGSAAAQRGEAAGVAAALIVTPRLRSSATSSAALALPASARRCVSEARASSEARSLAALSTVCTTTTFGRPSKRWIWTRSTKLNSRSPEYCCSKAPICG